MKHQFALLCLVVAGTANAEMIETAVIWNNTHLNEFIGAHTTDQMRTRCRIGWVPADHFIYNHLGPRGMLTWCPGPESNRHGVAPKGFSYPLQLSLLCSK